jgi:hypothetical protein
MMQNRSHKLVPSHPLLAANYQPSDSSEEFLSHQSTKDRDSSKNIRIQYDPIINMITKDMPKSSSE